MASTYEPIATTTLGSAASSITFSSIPSTYTDLRVVLVTKAASAGANTRIELNADTATNYSRTYLYGTGAAAGSSRETSQTAILLDYLGVSTTAPTFVAIDIFSYAGSTYKTLLWATSEDQNGSGTVVDGVGLYRSTSAINQVKLTNSQFTTGTTATLYGILKA